MTTTSETVPAVAADERVARCARAAYGIRTGVLDQAEAQGEGYVGQALGAADILAVVYADQLRCRPHEPEWVDRDRFLLSTGHYALLLYAALAEVGVIPREELTTYAADDSRLPMSAMSTYTPGAEISGGSLGHGLGLAVGMALGLRHQGRLDQRVFVLFSDGELNEGSTWEAAMEAANARLGNLVAMVDLNALQADGPTREVMQLDDQQQRWESFGWHAQRVDGNDLVALLAAFDAATTETDATGAPHVLLCDTTVGKGVEGLENREKAHFMKIAADEWSTCRAQLDDHYRILLGEDVR